VIKLNHDGVLQWARSLGGSGFDIGYEVGVDALNGRGDIAKPLCSRPTSGRCTRPNCRSSKS
jgi:hypothetical protein